jgi:anaerobic carbon-monoxide dehydrogenase iron sulfur subunit
MTTTDKTAFLLVHSDRCTGCRICEGICSIAQEGILNRAKSRIRIYRTNVLELNQKVCDQWEERPCVAACPTGAIFVKDRQVRVRRNACTGCGMCVAVCDKLFLSPDDAHVMMCNQCGACVKPCPENALEIGER